MTVPNQPLPFPDRREAPHMPTSQLDEPLRFMPEYMDAGLAEPYAKGFAQGQTAAQIFLTAAMTEQHGHAEETLRQKAVIDVKTGLLNDRGFSEAYEALRRSGDDAPLVVGYIDLDDFKQLNEEHGHVVVDELLGEIGRTMTAKIRGHEDVIARVGGDEFALILHGVDIGTGEKIISRLIQTAENDHGITLSVGIIEDDPSQTIRDVTLSANRRMQEAKEKHRAYGGSHIVADDMPPEPALV